MRYFSDLVNYSYFQNEFLEISGCEKLILNFAVFLDKENFDFFLDDVVKLVELVETIDWKEDLFNLGSLRRKDFFFDSTNSQNLENTQF